MQIKELQEYFKENFYDKSGRTKSLPIDKLIKNENHKQFINSIFKLEPRLNQDNLKLKHIEYFLFKDYSYEDLKCPFCNKLKDLKYSPKDPFLTSCNDHKKEAKEYLKLYKSKLQKEYMENPENKNRILNKLKENFRIKNILESSDDLKEYFKNKFIKQDGSLRPISINKLKENHFDFLSFLFKVEPKLNQDNLKFKHIYYFLFKDYSYEDLKCSNDNCALLKDPNSGTSKDPFNNFCPLHKNELKLKEIEEKEKKKLELKKKLLNQKQEDLNNKINLETFDNLKNYFVENFYDKNNQIKGISIKIAKKHHEKFFDKLFEIEPRLNQDNLKLKHIEYFLIKDYSFNDLKCPFCDKLKEAKHGKKRSPFLTSCNDHKEEAKEKNIKKYRILETINDLQEYFKENFYDKLGRIKGLKLKSLIKDHKNFIDKLFEIEPRLNQENLKSLHIEYFLFNNYKYENLKCQFCDKLRSTKYGKSREPFKISCEDHKKEAMEIINKERSIKAKLYMSNPENKKRIFDKMKKTIKERYGVDHPMKNKKIQEKMVQTQKERYGDITVKTKRKEIEDLWIKKYGANNPMKNKEIQEKTMNTQKNRYGDFAFVAKKEDIKKLWIEKYGFDNPMKNKEVIDKLIQTQKERYGNFVLVAKRDEIENTWFEKYNGKYPTQQHLKNIDKLNREYILENFFNENNEFLVYKFLDFYGYKTTSAAYYKLINLGINYNHRSGTSHYEDEIYDYIKSLDSNINIIKNDRSVLNPKELDLYIPEKNLAIEFDGMYWHSTNEKSKIKEYKDKHIQKTEACEAKNINLLHIFENEWLDENKKEIWKSIIRNKLGLINERYYARKLIIKEVPTKEATKFLEKNHIQGSCGAKVNIGLYNNEELLSMMTFGIPRYNREHEYELIRFVSKINTSCVGCAQKLFKHFIKQYKPNKIISYANRRFAYKHKNIYKILGFEIIRESEPNYYYFKLENINKMYHRSHFQKHKLIKYKDTKEFYDSSKTETEIMFNAGFRRIYDAGHFVYSYERD